MLKNFKEVLPCESPQIFSATNGSVSIYNMFENLPLTNKDVSFEQLGPEHQIICGIEKTCVSYFSVKTCCDLLLIFKAPNKNCSRQHFIISLPELKALGELIV